MCCEYSEATSGVAMLRIITFRPFVYRKFMPLGSPFSCVVAPLVVEGSGGNVLVRLNDIAVPDLPTGAKSFRKGFNNRNHH